jgi:site-specific DNA-methyltransferase (adenine-specific)
MTHTLHLGDCRTVMATLDDNSIDSIICDPPYELGFMGKSWDSTGIAYDVTVWRQCLRVLKPGGHLVAFGGSRTYHRLAVAIEDAGFEIRDQIQWIYGSGFPKSHNLKDEYQGWGTALKPAHEPAVLARKPLCGTVADNVMTWRVGALNIDGTRVSGAPWHRNDNGKGDPGMWAGKGQQHYAEQHTAGRWPANVILDEDAATALDAQSGYSKGTVPNPNIDYGGGDVNKNHIYQRGLSKSIQGTAPYPDSGGASRFFYTAKASKAEREAGLYYEEWQPAAVAGCNSESMEYRIENGVPTNPKAPPSQRANHHPTVKPLSLMRYLVRLVTPKGGKVLDPFMGSGSTGCAAVLEGFDFVGIDITPEYIAIAQKRIDHYAVTSPLMNL